MPTPPPHRHSGEGSAAPVPAGGRPAPDDIAVSALALRLVAARLEELAGSDPR